MTHGKSATPDSRRTPTVPDSHSHTSAARIRRHPTGQACNGFRLLGGRNLLTAYCRYLPASATIAQQQRQARACPPPRFHQTTAVRGRCVELPDYSPDVHVRASIEQPLSVTDLKSQHGEVKCRADHHRG